MDPMIKNSFSPMLICWNDIKIHLGFEDSYFVPPPNNGHFFTLLNKMCCGIFEIDEIFLQLLIFTLLF